MVVLLQESAVCRLAKNEDLKYVAHKFLQMAIAYHLVLFPILVKTVIMRIPLKELRKDLSLRNEEIVASWMLSGMCLSSEKLFAPSCSLINK
jgi:hypothetical protein